LDSIEVWTIGHSTRTADAFVGVLKAHGIECVADVRRFPGSRRHPQFGHEELARTLAGHGIDYVWLPELGGRRKADVPPADSAWRHPSFRAYAVHLESEEFAAGLERLLHLGAACRTAMMCSELLWWRCHRALIADVLRFRGFAVTHILSASQRRPHPYTSPARIVDGQLVYSPDGAPPCGDC